MALQPKTIVKKVAEVLEISSHKDDKKSRKAADKAGTPAADRAAYQGDEGRAKLLEFEHAAYLRDRIKKLQSGK